MSFPSPADLEAYLDEALSPELMAKVEQALRQDPKLHGELTAIHGRRDAGVHSLGEIWRRRRLTCPTREQLGSYLLGVECDELADYIAFHTEVAGCRACQANLLDLRQQQTEPRDKATARRHKYFQSSAGHLPRK
jgi:hypothetical protein